MVVKSLRRIIPLLIIAVVAVGLAACGTAPTPIGTFDRLTRAANGNVTVAGWSGFPSTTRATTIAVTANGRSVATVSATTSRPDVGAVHPDIGPNHGFSIVLPATRGATANGTAAAGTVLSGTVCVTATDPVTKTVSSLGCKSIPGRATTKGVVVPSSSKIDWNQSFTATRTGVAPYANSPSTAAACVAPLTSSSPASASQANRCLSWFSPPGKVQRPTIVWIHGGGWVGGTAEPVPAPLLRYVNMGWTIVAVQYRFSTCSANQFPTPIRDVQDAIAYIKSHAVALNVNPYQMVLFGHSAGAHLAALAGTGWNDTTGQLRSGPQYKVNAWVALSGMEDMSYFSTHSVWANLSWFFIPSTPTLKAACTDGATNWHAKPGLLDAASPVFQLDANDPPGFTIHGGSDSVAPAGPTSSTMGAAMVSFGRPNAFWSEVVADDGHNPSWNPVWMDSFLSQAVQLRDPAPPA